LQQNPISKNNANTQTKTNTRKRKEKEKREKKKRERDIEGRKNPRDVARLTDERRETKMGT
jgi:hypothetical protein